MNPTEKIILNKFKESLLKRLQISNIILFGSRARGDAEAFSDMDVIVVLGGECDDSAREYISECAWEAGYEHGIVVVPIVFTKDEWENGPERFSLLAQAVEREGLAI
jgi:uncharacterized protein